MRKNKMKDEEKKTWEKLEQKDEEMRQEQNKTEEMRQ